MTIRIMCPLIFATLKLIERRCPEPWNWNNNVYWCYGWMDIAYQGTDLYSGILIAAFVGLRTATQSFSVYLALLQHVTE